jgi:predicted ester cyclase
MIRRGLPGGGGLARRPRGEQHGAMAFDVERLLQLWTDLPPDDEAAAAAFREVYADPVVINGAPVPVAGLVTRARSLGAAFDGLERELLGVVDDGTTTAIAFRLRGRHVGPLGTAAGPVPATGRVLDLRVIDLLTLTDGRISSIWMVADELGALVSADAVRLTAPEPAVDPVG